MVTGAGVIAAVGDSLSAFAAALAAGQDGILPLTSIPASAELRFPNGAEVRGFHPEEHFDSRELPFLDRFAQMAVVAAREAVAQAGLDLPGAWPDAVRQRTAVVTGSCLGGRGAEEAGYRELFGHNRTRVHPLTIPLSMTNAAASHISMQMALEGPAWTVSTACASATHAIGQAFHLVRGGGAPMAVTGGSEATFFVGGLKAWESMRVVSKDTCRPFSAGRSGLILGEGAGMLVLEPLDAALARGARPLMEIVGFGMSADAGHITQPLGRGPARAMRLALEDAGLLPEQIGYINAHGTGTEANDRVETAAIREVFGPHADRLAVSSTKSMHGHALGAAGAIEAVASLVALRDGILPPTLHYLGADPACDLDVVPNAARASRVEFCLSNSFAFGGLNAVLAFKAYVPSGR